LLINHKKYLNAVFINYIYAVSVRNKISAFILLASYLVVIAHGVVSHHHHDAVGTTVLSHTHLNGDNIADGHYHSDGSYHPSHSDNRIDVYKCCAYGEREDHGHNHCHFNVDPVQVNISQFIAGFLACIDFDFNVFTDSDSDESGYYIVSKLPDKFFRAVPLRAPPYFS
jgi:hypothetical protein